MSIAQDYMTEAELVTELAPIFGRELSVRTLRRWAAAGQGPARIKVNKQIAYRRAAVEAWLNEHEQEPPRARRRKAA